MRLEWFGPGGATRLIASDLAVDDVQEDGAIACGANHALLVLSQGSNKQTKQVFSFGDNSQSQLGRGVDLDQSNQPSPVGDLPTNVIRVAAGEAHSVAVDTDGKVWTWGGSALVRGRQGPASIPMKIIKGLEDSAISITSIACGTEHTLGIDREGRMFAWGSYEDGRAGIKCLPGGQNHLLRPKLVDLPQGICAMAVACGAKHSLLLTSDLRVFSTGTTPANGSDLDCDRFSPIEPLCARRQSDPVTLIACGDSHSLVSTAKLFFSFGDGSCGKLGLGNEEDSCQPKAVSFAGEHFGALKIAAGRFHSLVLHDSGRLWVFGLEHVLKALVKEHGSKDLLPAKRAPATFALPKMFAEPAEATELELKATQIGSGSEFSLILLDPGNRLPRIDSSVNSASKPHTASEISPAFKTSKYELRPFSPRVTSTLFADEDGAALTIATLSKLLRDEEIRNAQLKKQLDEAMARLNELPEQYREHPGRLLVELEAAKAQNQTNSSL